MMTVSTSVAAVPSEYPDPPPDMAHPGSPHSELFSPFGGTTDRPLLVILVQFTDVPTLLGRDEAWAADRFFGPFPSVADYFDSASFGELNVFPARESQGTPNDGIVALDLSDGRDGEDPENDIDDDGDGLMDEDPPGDGDNDGTFDVWADIPSNVARNGVAIRHVDRFVPYADFDTPPAGIGNDELLIVVMRESQSAGDAFGQSQGVAGEGVLDLHLVGDVPVFTFLEGGFAASQFTTVTNTITMAHEILHAGVDMVDFYGFAVGNLDVAAASVGTSEVYFNPSPYNRLHWGWIRPTIVTRDGFYDVDQAHTSGEAFVLYDPFQPGRDPNNPNDYFIVENRQSVAGTYDQDATASGLAIWRVDDETLLTDVTEITRTIELMRPDGMRQVGCADEDFDGLNDEDPAGGIPIVFAGVDVTGDGTIRPDDDGNYLGYPIVDGSFDIDGDGEILEPADDSRTVGGVRIIQGQVDVDGDGRIDIGLDNGDPWGGVNNDGDDETDEDGPGPGCTDGDSGDVWAPRFCADPADPRTMDEPWADGTPSNVAVRAIGRSGPTIRAYFDVVGPGVLVDTCLADPSSGPAGGVRSISVDVMNTNDADRAFDTFDVSLFVPPGWTTTTERRNLTPKLNVPVRLEVTPAPDAEPGLYTLSTRATAVLDPSISSASPFTFVVQDPLEPNDSDTSAAPLDFLHPDDLDTRVLGNMSSLGFDQEIWSIDLPDLNLHNRLEEDWFEFVLPDPTDPAVGGHTELLDFPNPECSILERVGLDGRTLEDVRLTAALTVRAVARDSDGPGESLDVYDGFSATNIGVDDDDPFEATVGCPRTERALARVVTSFGDRPLGDSRERPLEYSLGASYGIAATRIPHESEWARDLIELRGLKALLAMPCPGGFFPDCATESEEGFELQHPMEVVPPGGCEQDSPGCPEAFMFWWEGMGGLDLKFRFEQDVAVQLIDEIGQVIAEAVPVDQVGSGAAGVVAQKTLADEPLSKRLLAPDLRPGFYGLRVTGQAGSYVVSFSPPPPAPDADEDGIVDPFDPCPSEAEDVDGFQDGDGCPEADNDQDGVEDQKDKCPNDANPEQGDLDADDIGDACDTENVILIDIKPGSAANKIKISAKGTTPVAILSTPSFDAPGRIDTTSLSFGRTGGEASLDRCSLAPKDVNGDGVGDLICHFVTGSTGLQMGDAVGHLRGQTLDAVSVEGKDDVRIVT